MSKHAALTDGFQANRLYGIIGIFHEIYNHFFMI